MTTFVALAEKWVQELHANPEKGFCEYKTTAIIRRVCEELGVETIDNGLETGVLAWLDNGCDETVALRADIDAVDFDSGPRHQCGHDHHTAALLGAMAYMKAHQKELRYNVAFIFQPAEESIAGAAALVEQEKAKLAANQQKAEAVQKRIAELNEMKAKGRAQNDKTRALCALKHVVVLCSNASISLSSQA